MTTRPPPAPQGISLDPLREWEKAENVATNFNDLLMRIRTFALPFIGTAIGAGSVLGTDQPHLTAPWLLLSALAAAAAFAFIISGFLLRYKAQLAGVLPPNSWELSLGLLIAVSAASWALILALERPESFSFSAPVLVFGGLLLFVIYLLDRFYYTALLIGTVERITELENQTSLRLTTKITQATPNWTFTFLPTALYLMPVLSLVNIGLAVLTFSEV